ncbi:MAG TPA: hypothetical protein VEF04_08445, partial [Blastocatellia bacterium]|nr:hypothetical protein [Blastocatellia bacterium]
MPSIEVLTQGAAPESNKRFTLNSGDALSDHRVPRVWKEVIQAGLTQSFLNQVWSLFAPHIHQNFPDFADRFGKLESLKAISRQQGEVQRGCIGLDAQIAVNTPAIETGTTVRGPHIDHPKKLFVGLLYLRHANDTTTGANLELCEPLSKPPVYGPKRSLRRDEVRVVQTVPYRHNTLVLFLNTPHSLHGVSPREQTNHARYFLNLVGEAHAPLFQLEERKSINTFISRLKSSLRH